MNNTLRAFVGTMALSSACGIPVNNLEVNCPADYHLAERELPSNVAVDLMIGGGRQEVTACLNNIFTSLEQLNAQCVQKHEELAITPKTGVYTWGCLPEDHDPIERPAR